MDFEGEGRDGRTNGRDGWREGGREGGVSRVVRRQAAIPLFDGKSSLRQARIYFKCQDET